MQAGTTAIPLDCRPLPGCDTERCDLTPSASHTRPKGRQYGTGSGLLKALGFVRRRAAFAVFWQTTTVAPAGIVIAVPVDIVVGRLICQAFAANLGVVAVPVVSARTFAVAALGTLILANVLAAGPVLVAARARPASLLWTE